MRQNSGAAEAKAVDGRVVIRLPRSWFNNKQRYFSLKLPVSPENLAYGVQIAARINSDYSLNQFDRTLAKYKPQHQPQYENYSVRQLWLKYCAYKAPCWKAKTQQYYEVILGRHIENMPQDWQSPLGIRTWLLKNTCFDRSVVKIGSEYHINHFSKTNRSRNFPCSERLSMLIAELNSSTLKQGAVFEGKFGMVNYEHLAKRAWPAIVSGAIGRKSTPYSCRDTFITRQIAAGKPPVLVAKWVDNSVAMIERKYLDISAILTIRPD